MPTRLLLEKHRRAATALAGPQEHVVSRRQLAAIVPKWFVRNEVRQGRWQQLGRQVVVTHNGPVAVDSTRWAAVLETGVAAALDGVTALQAAGLTGLSDTVVHVSAPRGSTPRKPSWAVVHETRRFRSEDVTRNGVPRMRPATAAVHAALWAVTDKQATLFVTMTVQQRLATVDELQVVLDRVLRHRRRSMLRRLLAELAGGAESLNELDVARSLRRRGLPEPTRQSIKKRPSGTVYLDNEFPEFRLALEVDGAGHDAPLQRHADVVRDLDLLAEGSNTIRIPIVAWRVDEEAVLDALERVFRARGWRPHAA
jgi:very-short-patch-repair endonuclease